MENANGICVSVNERELDLYIRLGEYSEGVGNFPDWSIIIVRSNFKKRTNKTWLVFQGVQPRYGYEYLCTEGDDYKYYQTLGLKLIYKEFFGRHNYGLPMKDLNI